MNDVTAMRFVIMLFIEERNHSGRRAFLTSFLAFKGSNTYEDNRLQIECFSNWLKNTTEFTHLPSNI